jgi:hypothetical protein
VAAEVELLMNEQSLMSVLRFTVRHPIMSLRHVLPNVRIERGTVPEGGAAPAAEHPETPAPAVDDEEPDDPLGQVHKAEQMVLDQQAISAVERASDSRLFGGRDRDEDRFVRLRLHETYHDVVLPGSQATQRVVFEPRVLMHETGVVQLTVRLHADKPLTTSQVLDFANGMAPRVLASELPGPLIAGSGWAMGSTDVSDPNSALSLFRVEHPRPVSMIDVLEAHLRGVLRVLRRSYGPWVNHPTVFVKPGQCCQPKRWDAVHGRDLVRLAVRAAGPADLASHVGLPDDLSFQADHSLYVELGSSLYVERSGRLPQPIDELWTVLVIEYALLLYMRLQTMEEKVANMRLEDRHLQRAYRDAVLLFSELRQGNLRSGEARMIASRALEVLGADKMRPTIESALGFAAEAHATLSATRAARRAWWLTAVGTAIATIVAVPSVTQVLRASRDVAPTEPHLVTRGLQFFDSLGFWGPWALLGSILVIAGIVALVASVLGHLPARRRSRRRGYAWPTRIKVLSSADASDDPEVNAEARAVER